MNVRAPYDEARERLRKAKVMGILQMRCEERYYSEPWIYSVPATPRPIVHCEGLKVLRTYMPMTRHDDLDFGRSDRARAVGRRELESTGAMTTPVPRSRFAASLAETSTRAPSTLA